jgi:ATP-binding cassette subfamily D (ALD) long-chain fatty acid import protein
MITQDIQRFSTHLAAIYANLAKPLLDVVLYNYQLSQNVGAEGLWLLTGLIQASALLRTWSASCLVNYAHNLLVRALTPPFGAFTAKSAQLAGSFRHAHSRLSEFVEEIAFFGGEETEKMLLEREYATGVNHENWVLRSRRWHGCVEEVMLICTYLRSLR